MKNDTFNKLVEERKTAQELIAVLSVSSHASAKSLIAIQEATIADIDAKLASSEKQFKLVGAFTAEVTEPLCMAARKALKSASVDFDALLVLRYDFAKDVVTADPRPAKAMSKASGSTFRYNGKALPQTLDINLGERGDKAKSYKRTGSIKANTEFPTWEKTYNALCECYDKLPAALAATDKYKASSARERLGRMTGGKFQTYDFVTEVPDATAEATANAVNEGERQADVASA